MSPEELPAQRLTPVFDLPPGPARFEPVVCYGDHEKGIIPKRRPPSMQYLGSFEWAWGPMHDRIVAYHLHRGRHHWVLYVEDLDPEMPQYAWMPLAYVERKNVDEHQAAVHLLLAAWKQERIDTGLDKFHWINEAGYLSVAEIKAIARKVWGS